MTASVASSSSGSLFGWWREGPSSAKRALLAAGLGWMLDSFDVMLYSLVLASLMSDLGIDKPTAGLLGSVTLIASAGGGLLFGVIADRYGRTKALMGSILTYSVFTAACGLSQSATQLAVFRVFLGIGMGGEWASGAALVSESWPREHRGKALGLMQSAWAIGYGAAAIVTWLVLPRYGWRAVFFVGVIPALLTMWIRRYVEEPAIWKARQPTGEHAFKQMFAPGVAGITVALTIMNACTLFAWWGFNLWLPGFLALPVAQGGVGLSTGTMSGFVVAMQVGMWFGYVTFGFISDALGRKRVYITYLIVAAVLLFTYVSVRTPIVLLLLGPFVAFFATGYYSGFGAVTAEVYPTAIRATAQGFTYNIGRVASAVAPYAVGSLAQTRGFSAALSICSVAFLLAAFTWIWIPETRGRELA
ncbi:MAG: MFS transporter [Vicinamibacterales bacterium]